ncbi:MAG: hypothetical protein K9K67_00875 [Bacteriovoracaceae bacterium]|nr:hypothetical protein [Bacteriovoracaceae bacterium]
MKKVIFDIGTHEAQELRVLTGDRLYIAKVYLYWWFDWVRRQVKKLINYNGLIKYGEGAFIESPANYGVTTHFWYLSLFLSPENYLRSFTAVLVDPVVEVVMGFFSKLRTKFKRALFLPIAVLPHEFINESKLVTFYIEKNSLSSSLFYSGESDELTLCSGYSFDKVINDLHNEDLLAGGDLIVLRMNCEGAELGVVKSLIEKSLCPSLILGSINDVFKKYGQELASELDQMIEGNNIKFCYFKGSDPSTWIKAIEAIKEI